MTGNIFVDCIFLFLICYALASIFHDLSVFLLERYCRYPLKSFLTLELKSGTESLETDLRAAISKSLSLRCGLVVVCNNLNLEEHKVVWRLTDVYDHIVLTTREELADKLDTAADISASL